MKGEKSKMIMEKMVKKLMLPIIGMVAMLIVACGELEGSDNGSLDGLWQLTQIDSVSSGARVSMSQRQVFWSVQGKLLEIRDHLEEDGNGHYAVFFKFEFSGDTLNISKPIINDRRISDREPEVSETAVYGIQYLGEPFLVNRLTSKQMVLETCRQEPLENVRMYFRKY